MSPRQPPVLLAPNEKFRFAVEDWWLEYSLHLWDVKPMPDMERGGEMISVVVSGTPLESKTQRRIKRIEMSLIPGDFDPNKPQPHWKSIGGSDRASGGVLRPQVYLPSAAFQTFVVSLAANRVSALKFDLHRAAHGYSLVKNFSTINPGSDSESEQSGGRQPSAGR